MTTENDPLWDELPEGINLISDGDKVVGIGWGDDVDLDVEAVNIVLAKAGLPLLDRSF